jgi:hypothetical protein
MGGKKAGGERTAIKMVDTGNPRLGREAVPVFDMFGPGRTRGPDEALQPVG